MKPGKLAAGLFRFLVGLAMVSAFVVLDWHSLVQELGGLRREQGDLKRKTAEHNALSVRFSFPDAQEQALLAGSDSDLEQTLLLADRDGVWTESCISELRTLAGKDGVRSIRCWVAPPKTGDGDIGTGGGALLVEWINRSQAAAVSEAFAIAADPDRSPWRGTFAGMQLSPGRRLASRSLVIVLGAPLPALLDFVNHISWGATRLEIVRLHLEPAAPDSRAWMVVRGHFFSGYPSPWDLHWEKGQGDDLLIDPDSPVLWQKVGPGIASREQHNELPPVGGRDRE